MLAGREPIGWRLGLERMRRLCTLLGMPQNRFASIHVVGTNGKTSVTGMAAALIEARGHSAGAYISPHIMSWRERIVIDGEPISAEAFDRAVERTEQTAETADRAAGEEGPVSQYELLTAAAFVAFAEARVEYAVIEAGLGGRLDATNVIPSRVTVLTSVGLDHTEWLGDTVEQIAAEKLAVLRDHTVLVRGELPAAVEPVVEREVARRHTRVERAPLRLDFPEDAATEDMADPLPGFQQRNLSLAAIAVSELLGADAGPRGMVPISADRIATPGRAQVEAGNPTLIYDVAHNPDGAKALAEALPALAGGAPVVACIAVLAGKDAAGIASALEPACEAIVCTEFPAEVIANSGRPGGEALAAADLAAICERAGASAEAVADPIEAWSRARTLASERGGAALAAGSHYLLRCLWTERPAASY